MNKYNLRKIFLEEFTKELIRSAGKNAPLKSDQISEPIIEIPIAAEEERQIISIVSPQQIPSIEEPVQDNFDWGKVLPLMQDPSVTMVECPGPEKNLVVRQNNIHAATSFSLTKEEIRALIEKIESKTQTAVNEGILQAETLQATVTAVLSDYVGDRFIIQKKVNM